MIHGTNNNGWVNVPGCMKTEARRLLTNEALQVLEVKVNPGGEIPLHAHNCAATMIVTEGEAKATGHTPRQVKKGDIIVKKPREAHGFTQVDSPFVFISVSDGEGIMHETDWDIGYVR